MNIFPEGSLAVSLITTVWVGLFVICFFNLSLGWTISGLIVPGYLAPLLILKPWSATAVIIEAVFTYLLVITFSKIGEKTGLYSELFGRDRFFFILLISVIARLFFDEAVFPCLTSILREHLELDFRYRDGLYSIGLVIVALTANQFWTSGLKRGLFQLIVTLTITFLLIKYLLIGFTNFRLNEVANVYENLATSILASPKAYIILLTTAFVASRMSLAYGWEFSGIAIPALLALLWYNPMEILISIAEAIIIYLIASFLLKTKFLSRYSIEGAAKILFFFNVSFFYKFILGYVLGVFFAVNSPSDYYGFGYMLTSLIAIKMHEKGFGARIIGSTVITSAFSVILATIIGFLLTFTTSHYKYTDITKAIKAYEISNAKPTGELPLKFKESKPLFLTNLPITTPEIKLKSKKLSLSELKFIDARLASPLLRIPFPQPSLSYLEKPLNNAAKAADSLGLKIVLFGNQAFHPNYLEIVGNSVKNMPCTFLLTLSSSKNIILCADCSSIASLTLTKNLETAFRPRVLLFNALFSKNHDSPIKVEVSKNEVKGSLYDLLSQISIRELDKNSVPLDILQIETVPENANLQKNTIYVSTDKGAYSLETVNKTQYDILTYLSSKGYKISFVNGSKETVKMEASNLSSSKYMEMTTNSSLMVLWLKE